MRCAAASSISIAPGMAEPVRLDFFGDTLETIRSFDPETQRTTDQLRALDLVPVTEFQLTTETIKRFRLGYVEAFGAPTPDDLLYDAVSEGRRHPGMEHWLPLFHERLETMFDYVPGSPVVLEPLAEDAARERLDQIKDYYEARQRGADRAHSGAALPAAAARPALSRRRRMAQAPRCRGAGAADAVRGAGRPGRGRSTSAPGRAAISRAERAEPGRNVFEAVTEHVQRAARRRASASSSRCGARARAIA